MSIQVVRNEIDSQVLGRAVLEIFDADASCDIAAVEMAYRREHDPAYVICKVPAEDLESVHALEKNGFHFLEFQLRLTGTISREYDTSAYPYRYVKVTSEAELQPVLAIVSTMFEHDRFSRDPLLQAAGSASASDERYRRYIMKSLTSRDECVFRLVSDATGDTVAFGTHRHLRESEALLLLGGVKSDLRRSGLGMINDHFGLNQLRREGIRRFTTHMSAANYPILNMEIRALGFRVVAGLVVMRKAYR